MGVSRRARLDLGCWPRPESAADVFRVGLCDRRIELKHGTVRDMSCEEFRMRKLGQQLQTVHHSRTRAAERTVIDQIYLPRTDCRQIIPSRLRHQPGYFPNAASQVRRAQVDVELFRHSGQHFLPRDALGRTPRDEPLRQTSSSPAHQVSDPMPTDYEGIYPFQREDRRVERRG